MKTQGRWSEMIVTNKESDSMRKTGSVSATKSHLKRAANIALREIEDYACEIAEKFDPERVILFGSYAYGKPSFDSDVDLLVVMEFDGRAVDKAYEIRRATESSFPLDLLVRRPSILSKRIALGDSFLKEVIERGKVLYERTRP